MNVEIEGLEMCNCPDSHDIAIFLTYKLCLVSLI